MEMSKFNFAVTAALQTSGLKSPDITIWILMENKDPA